MPRPKLPYSLRTRTERVSNFSSAQAAVAKLSQLLCDTPSKLAPATHYRIVETDTDRVIAYANFADSLNEWDMVIRRSRLCRVENN